MISREQIVEDYGDLGKMTTLVMDELAISDVRQIGSGAYFPLSGFLDAEDYRSVVEHMRLSTGQVWSLPIVLPVPIDRVAEFHVGMSFALVDTAHHLHAVMKITSLYAAKPDDMIKIFGTDDAAHPGVKMALDRGSVFVGGPIHVLPFELAEVYANYPHTPAVTRVLIAQKGWKTVVGFQTRNPIHRAHEYIQKCALENVDGLLVHPLVGPTKAADVSAVVRMKAYEVLINNYFPEERTILGIFTGAMRYAGPREAIHHALVRKNFGCTHFIVGRDHAGVGNYYGTYDAQAIFSNFTVEELGITPVFFDHAFYCNACKGMATSKTCPHGDDQHIILSGTKVREMLSEGIAPPEEFSRHEVVKVLMEYYGEGML
jgi:sulfate adenylyltransferase